MKAIDVIKKVRKGSQLASFNFHITQQTVFTISFCILDQSDGPVVERLPHNR